MNKDLISFFKRDHDADITTLFDLNPYLSRIKDLPSENLLLAFAKTLPKEGMSYEIINEQQLRDKYPIIEENQRILNTYTCVRKEKDLLISAAYGVMVEDKNGEELNIILEGGLEKNVARFYLAQSDLRNKEGIIVKKIFSN